MNCPDELFVVFTSCLLLWVGKLLISAKGPPTCPVIDWTHNLITLLGWGGGLQHVLWLTERIILLLCWGGKGGSNMSCDWLNASSYYTAGGGGFNMFLFCFFVFCFFWQKIMGCNKSCNILKLWKILYWLKEKLAKRFHFIYIYINYRCYLLEIRYSP